MTTEKRYTVVVYDHSPASMAVEHVLEADSVQGIAEQLAALTFSLEGQTPVEVRSDNGELHGWAHANGDWRCA